MTSDYQRSPHVLNASSTLMGICFVIQTSIRVLGYGSRSIVDELTAVATCIFMLACVFSYLSIRAPHGRRSERMERVADIIFLSGLLLLTGMVVLISVNEIR